MTPAHDPQADNTAQVDPPRYNTGSDLVPQPMYPPQSYGQQPMYPPQAYGQQPYRGPVGQVRGTGFGILMSIITLGIYPLYWYFAVHEEMKRHNGQGLGGGLALVLALFVGVAMPFLTSSEIGNLHAAQGRKAPVSGLTGLWYYPGFLILVGPIVWWVKTNGALNDYWRSVGAR